MEIATIGKRLVSIDKGDESINCDGITGEGPRNTVRALLFVRSEIEKFLDTATGAVYRTWSVDGEKEKR